MPKKQDWLDIIEKSSELKKGTKIPKGVDIYALMTLMNPPSRNPQGGMSAAPWNTGAGANGVVEPGKAVSLDMSTNPPSVYHEGETVKPFPGGKEIIPARTEMQQQDLGMKQKDMNLPGYATGGTVYQDPKSFNNSLSVRPKNVYDLTPQQEMYQAGTDQAFKTTQQRASGNDPVMNKITNMALQNYDTRAAVSDTAARQAVVSDPYATVGTKNAVAAKQRATYSAGLSGLVGDLSTQSMNRAEAANTELFNMGRTGVQDDLAKQTAEKTFGEQQYTTDLGQNRWQQEFKNSNDQWQQAFKFEKQKYGNEAFTRMAEDAQTTSYETWIKQHPYANEQDYNTAREYKAMQLQNMGITNATASENLTQLKKSDSWADAERFLAAGDFTNYAALVKSITGKDINTTDFQADVAYEKAIRSQNIDMNQIQIDANRFGLSVDKMQAIISDINNGVPLGTINTKYPDARLTSADYSSIAARYRQAISSGNLALTAQDIANEAAMLGISSDRLSTFINAVNSGGDIEAANQASGLNLTQDQMDGISTKYRQSVEAGNIELESTRNKVGNEMYNSIQEMINGGSSLAEVNARLLEQGKQPMTLSEFQGMVEATPLGERNWGRNMTYANMLLQTQDPNNLVQAQRIFGEMFPGTTFDMNQLISDLGAERYAGAMTDMATLSSTFKTWEEAKGSAEGLNLIETLGLGQDDGEIKAKQLFQGLKINAIDEAWTAIEDTGFYQDLLRNKPDTAKLIQETFTAGLTGELEFDIKPVYNVVDKDGGFVKSFNTVTDANTFLGENAEKEYSVQEKSNYIYKNMFTGDSVVINNGTGNENGVATFDGNNMWSKDNYGVLNDPSNKDFASAIDTLTQNVVETGRYKQLRDVVQDNELMKKYLLENSPSISMFGTSKNNYTEGQLVKKESFEQLTGPFINGGGLKTPTTVRKITSLEIITSITMDEDGNSIYKTYPLYATYIDENGNAVDEDLNK
jgi:hypothetical protein